MDNEQKTLEELKRIRDEAIRVAAKAAYDYFGACEVGEERCYASDIYENLRTSTRKF